MAKKGAVKVVVVGEANLKQIDAAQKDLDKLRANAIKNEKGFSGAFKRMGVSMESVGMYAGIAAAAVGAFAMSSIQAYKDSEAASLRLQNTLSNMPKLAGENAESFKALAGQLQDLTAVEDDVAVEAMAMLGTFNLTGNEIRSITPLVADYARKFGVDMVEASKSVGKALAGQIGALKRNGVTIDEAAYKTNRFTAVQEALRNQVGGFAEQEAQSGIAAAEQLANKFDDLKEAFGEGLVGGDIAEATEGVRELGDAMDDLQPVLKGVGEFMRNVVVDFNDGIQNTAEEVLWLERALGMMDPTTKHLWDAWKDGAEQAGVSFNEFRREVYSGDRTVKDFYVATDAMAGGLADATDASGDYTDSTEDATDAQDELTRAMDGTMTTMDDLSGRMRTYKEAQMDAEEAAIRVRDAEQNLKDVRADSESTTDDIRKAELDLERAKLRSADASADLKTAARDTGMVLGQQADDESYAEWLKRIERAGRDAATQLSNVQRNSTVKAPGSSLKQTLRYGAGGIITSPELALIGERGHTEYAITTEPLFRSRSLALYDQLGRDLGVNNSRTITIAPGAVVVQAGGAASPYEVARIVDEQLRRTVRQASLMGA